jgi:hypothetical protein
LIRLEKRLEGIEAYRAEHGIWGGQIAKARGTVWKPTKVANPIFAEALPYLKELKAKGYSLREICEKATAKYGYEFKRAWVHRLLKRDEEKHGEKHDA